MLKWLLVAPSALLVAAQKAPHAEPAGHACTAVGEIAVDRVKSTVTSMVDGVVPLRNRVRRLSGAGQHSSAVAAAISAGTLRRAWLKGWGQVTGCILPSPSQAPAGTLTRAPDR
jgi:hypothetical protein